MSTRRDQPEQVTGRAGDDHAHSGNPRRRLPVGRDCRQPLAGQQAPDHVRRRRGRIADGVRPARWTALRLITQLDGPDARLVLLGHRPGRLHDAKEIGQVHGGTTPASFPGTAAQNTTVVSSSRRRRRHALGHRPGRHGMRAT